MEVQNSIKFKDNQLHETFLKEGIVKVPLLDKEEVSVLKTYIEEKTPLVHMANEYGFIQGVCLTDLALKKDLDETIRKVVHPKAEVVLDNFQSLIYTALGKGANSYSELDIHQDWSLVDEDKYFSISLWIPLIDSNERNGTIHYLEGSHLSYTNKRAGSIPSIFTNNSKEIKKKMKPIEVKAGEALMFHQRLVHYSPINNSNKARISLISSLVPKDATIIQYYLNHNKELETFQMSKDFFFQYDNFIEEKNRRPKGVKIE